MLPPILGISGKGQAGKDTVADYILTKDMWVDKASFAFNLKKVCSKFFGLEINRFLKQDLKCKKFRRPLIITRKKYAELITTILEGESYTIPNLPDKYVHTPRELLQYIGTDVLRRANDNCHVIMFRKLYGKGDGLIVTDVRFENEAQFIREQGGMLVRIERPQRYLLRSNHPSETSLDYWFDWDYVLNNDKLGEEHLYRRVDKMLNCLLFGGNENALSD